MRIQPFDTYGHYRGRRAGMSMLEILVVLVIGAVLMSAFVRPVSDASKRYSTRNARDAVMWYTVKSKAIAVERGATADLWIDPSTSRLVITVGGNVIDQLDLMDEYAVGVSSDVSLGVIHLCFIPRGYADPGCGSSPNLPVTLSFSRGEESVSARLWPLGQVQRL